MFFGNFQLFVEEHSEVSGSKAYQYWIILNLNANDCWALEYHLKES